MSSIVSYAIMTNTNKERKSQTLKAAVIGLGVGEKHISGFMSDPRCSVEMICDIDSDKLSAVGARYPGTRLTNEPENVLSNEEIDVVSIASYDDVHCDQIVKAINSGKHVFAEKPICQTTDELKKVRTALAENPYVCLSSNMILRETNRFKKLKQRIHDGELGDIYYFEGDYDYGRLEKLLYGWRGDISNYSVFLGGAIHLVDLFLWMVGGEPKTIHGLSSNFCARGSKFKGADFTAALVACSNDVIAKFSANYGSATPHHHRLAVYGTRGSFIQTHLGAAYYFGRGSECVVTEVNDDYPGTAKGDLIPNFIASILDGDDPIIRVSEVLNCMDFSLKIDEVARNI
jgi:predicted dehydrogenase